MRAVRWVLLGLAAVAVAAAVVVASPLLEDRRIRLRDLITLDPPAAPLDVRLGGHALSVTGALVREAGPGHVVLRAFAPTPAIRVVEAAGPGAVRVDVENLPLRARLDAAGPVEETRQGLTRALRFAPEATRRLAFLPPEREATFAALGDTGDSGEFAGALRLAGLKGADFFLHGGDVVYEDVQIPVIERMLDASPVPVYVSRGNHDYRNEERIRFMRRLGPPYHAFRWGGATFVVLDNGGDYLPTYWRRSTQYRWWRAQAGEPRTGPLFVLMHKPPFDRRTGPRRAPMLDRPFARQLLADFTRAGVDAVFTGHVHGTYHWVEGGVPYVVSGEGYMSLDGWDRNRMTWARVRGFEVSVEQIPIWRRPGR